MIFIYLYKYPHDVEKLWIFMLFSMDNIVLIAVVNLICFAVFGLFYALVYKITSSSYYTIVSGRREL